MVAVDGTIKQRHSKLLEHDSAKDTVLRTAAKLAFDKPKHPNCWAA